jgi:hypothetical protein
LNADGRSTATIPCRVLIVGMADSIHLARWISQFEDSEIEFRIVSSSPHRRIHKYISELLIAPNRKISVSMGAISKWLSLPLWVADRFLSDFLRGLLIAIEIRKFRPAFVHANEIQNAGYAALRAMKILRFKNVPLLFTTNYGSELFWYGAYKNHRKKIVELLRHSAAFSAECKRDYSLAENFGFSGTNMPQMPVAGGARFRNQVVEARRTIAVKGYQNKWGQALSVLDCLTDLQDALAGFKIEVFSANKSVERRVKYLRRTSRLQIVSYSKGSLSHEAMMQLFSRSICYIGFSLSDGISTSMIESMANGAVPIQTSTSCAEEWIQHGKTGFILDPTDLEGLKKALLSITQGDFDANQARLENSKVIDEKYDPDNLSNIAKEQYRIMLSLTR